MSPGDGAQIIRRSWFYESSVGRAGLRHMLGSRFWQTELRKDGLDPYVGLPHLSLSVRTRMNQAQPFLRVR